MKKGERNKSFTRAQKGFAVSYFLLSVFLIVFSILCIYQADNAIVKKFAFVFSCLAGAIVCTLFAFSVWCIAQEKETWSKISLSSYILLAFLLIVLFILQRTGFFEVVQDFKHLQAWLEKADGWMPILYIIMQCLQVVILPIPSFVSTGAGVALFGPIRTILYSFIGIITGSLIAFYIGRKLGKKSVAWMIGEDNLDKWQSKLKGKDNFWLTVMFLLPFFPDDVLCFIAGLSTISERYFIIMIAISRSITIASTCYTLSFIPLNTWWGILIWAILIAIVAIGVFLLYKNLDKLQEWGAKHKKEHRKNRK